MVCSWPRRCAAPCARAPDATDLPTLTQTVAAKGLVTRRMTTAADILKFTPIRFLLGCVLVPASLIAVAGGPAYAGSLLVGPAGLVAGGLASLAGLLVGVLMLRTTRLPPAEFPAYASAAMSVVVDVVAAVAAVLTTLCVVRARALHARRCTVCDSATSPTRASLAGALVSGSIQRQIAAELGYTCACLLVVPLSVPLLLSPWRWRLYKAEAARQSGDVGKVMVTVVVQSLKALSDWPALLLLAPLLLVSGLRTRAAWHVLTQGSPDRWARDLGALALRLVLDLPFLALALPSVVTLYRLPQMVREAGAAPAADGTTTSAQGPGRSEHASGSPWPLRRALLHQTGLLLWDAVTLLLAAPPLLATVYRVPRALRAAAPHARGASPCHRPPSGGEGDDVGSLWRRAHWHRVLLGHAGAVIVDLLHLALVLVAAVSVVRTASVLRDCLREDDESGTAWRRAARSHAVRAPCDLLMLLLVTAVVLPLPYRLVSLARKLWNTPDPNDRAVAMMGCIRDALMDLAALLPLLAGAALAPWRGLAFGVDACGRAAPLQTARDRRRDALFRFVLALADWFCTLLGVPVLVPAFYRLPAALRALSSAAEPGVGICSTLPRRATAQGAAASPGTEAVASAAEAQGGAGPAHTIPGLGARLAPHRAFLRVVGSAAADLPFIPVGVVALAVPWRTRLAWESMRLPGSTAWQARGRLLLHMLLLIPDTACWVLAAATTALLLRAAALWRGLACIPANNPFLPRCVVLRHNPVASSRPDRTRSLMQAEGSAQTSCESGSSGGGGAEQKVHTTGSLLAPHLHVLQMFWESLFALVLIQFAAAATAVMPWRVAELLHALRGFLRRASAARTSRTSPPLPGTKRGVALLAARAAALGLADYVAAAAALLHLPVPYRARPLLIRLRRARDQTSATAAATAAAAAAAADAADEDGDSEPPADARAFLPPHSSLAQRLVLHRVLMQETGLLLLELPLAVLMWATVVVPWRAVLLQVELWRAGERTSARHRATLRHTALALLDLPAFVIALVLQATWRGPGLVRRLATLSLAQWGTARPHRDMGHQLLQLVLDLPVFAASALLAVAPWRVPGLLHFLVVRKSGSNGQRRKRVLRQVLLGLVDYLCLLIMVAMLLTFWRVPHLWRRFRRSRESLNAKKAARQARREQEEAAAEKEAEEWARWRRTLAGDGEAEREGEARRGGAGPADAAVYSGRPIAPSHTVPTAPAVGTAAASAPPVDLSPAPSGIVPSAPPLTAESAVLGAGAGGEEKRESKRGEEPLASEMSLLFSALHESVLMEGSEAARDVPHAVLVLGMAVLAPWRAISLRRRHASMRREAVETGKEATAARARALCRDEGVEWLYDLPFVPCALLVLVTLIRAVPLVRDWRYLSDSPSRRFAAGQHAALLLLDAPCALSWLVLQPARWRHAALKRASAASGGYWGRYGADRPLSKRLWLSLTIMGQAALVATVDLPAAAVALLIMLTGWRASEVCADVRSSADADAVSALRPHTWVAYHALMLLVDLPFLVLALAGAVLAPWHIPALCRGLTRTPRANARRPVLAKAFLSALLDLPCVLLCCSLLVAAFWRLARLLLDCFSSTGRAKTASQRRAAVLEGSVLALCDFALLPAAAVLCTFGLGRLPGAWRVAAVTRGPFAAYKPHMGVGSRLRWHTRLLGAAASAVLDLPFVLMALAVAVTGYRLPSMARAFALEGYLWGWAERCLLGRQAVVQPAAVAALSRRFGHSRRRAPSSSDTGSGTASARASIASEGACSGASHGSSSDGEAVDEGSTRDSDVDNYAEDDGAGAEPPRHGSPNEPEHADADTSAHASARARAIAALLPSAPTAAPAATEPSAPPAATQSAYPLSSHEPPPSGAESEAGAPVRAADDPGEGVWSDAAGEGFQQVLPSDAHDADPSGGGAGVATNAAVSPPSEEGAPDAGETEAPATVTTGDDPTDSDVEAELEHAAWHRRRWFSLSASLSRAWVSAKRRLGLVEEDYACAAAFRGPASSLGGPQVVAQARQAVLDARSDALEEVRRTCGDDAPSGGGAAAVRPRAPLQGVTALPLGAQWRIMELAGPQDTAKCEVAARHWRDVSVFAPHVWERFCEAERFSAPLDRPWLHPKEVYVREWLRERREEARFADAETRAARAQARYAMQRRRMRSAPCCSGVAWALRSGRGIVLAAFTELVLDLPFFAIAAATALLPWRFVLLLRDCFWPSQRVPHEGLEGSHSEERAAPRRPGALWTSQRRTAVMEQLTMALLDALALPLLAACALSGYRLRRIRAELERAGVSLALLVSPYRPRRATFRRLRAHGAILKHGLALLVLDSVPLCAFLASLALAPWRFAGARRRLASLRGCSDCSWYLLGLTSPLVVVHDYISVLLGVGIAVTLVRLPTLVHGLRARSRRMLALRGYDLPAFAIPYRCAGLLLHDAVTLVFVVPALLLTVLRLPIALERVRRVLRARHDLRRAHRAVAARWGHWVRAAASTEIWRAKCVTDLACADNLAIRGHAVAVVRAASGEGGAEATGQGDKSMLPWDSRRPRRDTAWQRGSDGASVTSFGIRKDVRDPREAEDWCSSTSAAAAAACVNDQGAAAVTACVAAEAVSVARGYAVASVDLSGVARWAWLPGVAQKRGAGLQMDSVDVTVTPALLPAPCTAPREVLYARQGCISLLASGSSLAKCICLPLALCFRCFTCFAACVPACFFCCRCLCCARSRDEESSTVATARRQRLPDTEAGREGEAEGENGPALVKAGPGSSCFKGRSVRFPLLGTGAAASWLEMGGYRLFWPLLAAPSWHDTASTLLASRAAERRRQQGLLRGPRSSQALAPTEEEEEEEDALLPGPMEVVCSADLLIAWRHFSLMEGDVDAPASLTLIAPVLVTEATRALRLIPHVITAPLKLAAVPLLPVVWAALRLVLPTARGSQASSWFTLTHAERLMAVPPCDAVTIVHALGQAGDRNPGEGAALDPASIKRGIDLGSAFLAASHPRRGEWDGSGGAAHEWQHALSASQRGVSQALWRASYRTLLEDARRASPWASWPHTLLCWALSLAPPTMTVSAAEQWLVMALILLPVMLAWAAVAALSLPLVLLGRLYAALGAGTAEAFPIARNGGLRARIRGLGTQAELVSGERRAWEDVADVFAAWANEHVAAMADQEAKRRRGGLCAAGLRALLLGLGLAYLVGVPAAAAAQGEPWNAPTAARAGAGVAAALLWAAVVQTSTSIQRRCPGYSPLGAVQALAIAILQAATCSSTVLLYRMTLPLSLLTHALFRQRRTCGCLGELLIAAVGIAAIAWPALLGLAVLEAVGPLDPASRIAGYVCIAAITLLCLVYTVRGMGGNWSDFPRYRRQAAQRERALLEEVNRATARRARLSHTSGGARYERIVRLVQRIKHSHSAAPALTESEAAAIASRIAQHGEV